MDLPWQALCIHPRLTCSPPALLCRPVPRQGHRGATPTTSIATNTVPIATTTVLLAQTQPRLLLEILDDTLRRTWSFPNDIVSFCWAGASDSVQADSKLLRTLIATEDGTIWSIPLQVFEAPETRARNENSTVRQQPARVTIEINDSEDEVEIELWNDEDGLLDSPGKLSSLTSPATKRQRISSPPPPSPPKPSPSLPNNQDGHICVQVNTSHHLVGSEEDVTAIIWTLDGLLILRQGKDPVLWISQQGYYPGATIEKRVIVTKPQLLNASHGLGGTSSTFKAFVGTKSGAIYHIKDNHSVTVAQKIHSLQEPVASLILIPYPHVAQAESLLIVGTLGGICWIDLQASADPSPAAVSTKTSIEAGIQSSFLANGYMYVLTTDGCILRVLVSSLSSDRNFNWERLDLPRLLAFVPIMTQASEVNGFYGINCNGRILRFAADLKSSSRPRVTSEARDNVTNALVELERLSDHAKRLEAECQAENQRIATFNRLIQELQRCALSQVDQGRLMDSYTPPVSVTFTACVQPVAEGYNGDRRYFVRLSLQSALNISWDKGWSAAVTMRTNKKCPHRKNSESGRHNEVFASLADLSPHTPWTRDFDIDLQSLDLPLTITLGLQLHEEKHKSADNLVSAYFYVESFDLDAIHFAEPVRDPPKGFTSFSTYASSTRTQALGGGGGGETNRSQDSIRRMYRPLSEHDNECQECVQELTESNLKPIAFVIDTQEIQAAQCLPALLGDGVPSDRMMALVQSAFRGSLYLPEECLPRTAEVEASSTSGLPWQQTAGLALASQPDIGKVWVTMETKDNTGSTNSIVSATLSVKGLDPKRIRIVYRALERRVAELFEQ